MKNTTEKTNLHPRNLHNFGYDFDVLIKINKDLEQHVFVNNFNTKTIDFSNPKSVKSLNQSLLIQYYNIDFWDLPDDYLCPPIPGRADYIHYIADLLASNHNNNIPLGEQVLGLDVGVGSNCIYPILGNAIYDWTFVATDIDENAIKNCKKIISQNPK